jgi:hypothetical protein
MQKLTAYVRRHWLASAVLVATACVIGGAAYAAIPDASGTIHGCYSANGARSTGGTQLNIINSDLASCSKGQQEVIWNGLPPQSFAKSAQSCPAETFVQGFDAAGSVLCDRPAPPVSYEASTTDQIHFATAYDFEPLGTLTIPIAGTYLFTAKATLDAGSDGNIFDCRLFHDSDTYPNWFDSGTVWLDGSSIFGSINAEVGMVMLEGRLTVSTNETVTFGCEPRADTDSLTTAFGGRLDAVQVTAG